MRTERQRGKRNPRNRFHNFEQRTDNMSNEELEALFEKRLEELRKEMEKEDRMRYFYGAKRFLKEEEYPLGFQRCHLNFQTVYSNVYEFNRMVSQQDCQRLGLMFILSIEEDEDDD